MFGVNDLVYGSRPKVAGNFIDALRLSRGGLGGRTVRNLGLNFAFDLCFDRFVLRGTPRFFHCQLVVHFVISDCQMSIADFKSYSKLLQSAIGNQKSTISMAERVGF